MLFFLLTWFTYIPIVLLDSLLVPHETSLFVVINGLLKRLMSIDEFDLTIHSKMLYISPRSRFMWKWFTQQPIIS